MAAGHPDPLSYTPTQAIAFGELADRRRMGEARDAYTLQRNAIAAGLGALKEADEKKFLAAFEED